MNADVVDEDILTLG